MGARLGGALITRRVRSLRFPTPMVQMYRDPQAPAPGVYGVVRLEQPSAAPLAPESPAWNRAAAIEWGPARYRTTFRACWDADALHVRFDAVDDGPWHTMTSRDDHLWEQEVVELFLDPAGEGRDYAELEINPAGVVCDLRVETPWPALRALIEWDWEGMAATVHPLEGGAAGRGWTAIARLPLAALGSLSPHAAGKLPPSPGDRWKFNVFRIKRPGGPERPEEGAVYAAWSVPSGPSFHDPAACQPFAFEP